jgi:DNA-nicking Smr family endonuclease
MYEDLHGYTVHGAWLRFKHVVSDAHSMNYKSITFITGQGKIMRDFPEWANVNPLIQSYTSPSHNPGQFVVKLKKKG